MAENWHFLNGFVHRARSMNGFRAGLYSARAACTPFYTNSIPPSTTAGGLRAPPAHLIFPMKTVGQTEGWALVTPQGMDEHPVAAARAGVPLGPRQTRHGDQHSCFGLCSYRPTMINPAHLRGINSERNFILDKRTP